MRFVVLLPFLFIAFMVVLILVTQSQQRKGQREYWRSLPPSRQPLPDSPKCPRCESGMVRGYLLDRTHGGFGMGTWLEGPPVRSGWSEMIRPRLERSIPVVSYRCTGRGYLELYARPELVEELESGKPARYPELRPRDYVAGATAIARSR